jgi:hypothetical protein
MVDEQHISDDASTVIAELENLVRQMQQKADLFL